MEEKEPQNLWSTLLKESSKRFKAPEATCVFLGDTGIGKSSLVQRIGGSSNFDSGSNGRIISDILSYAFIDVDEGILNSESVSRINLWSIGDKTFEGCLENVVKPGKSSERLLFMIGVDISNPDACLDSLKKWLRKVKNFAGQSRQGDVEWRNLNLSIIILACKSDLLKVDDATGLKIARTAQGQLRAIGLATGAAVVYTSSKSDINTARLRRHVIGKLYPEASCVEESIEDGISTAFIPSGMDSPELIRIATGLLISPLGDEIIALLNSPLSRAVEHEESNTIDLTSLDLESEEDWLTGLQSFISEVTSSGSIPLSLSSQSSVTGTASGTGTGTHTGLASEASYGEPIAKPISKRSFRAPVAAQEKQDVDDFFQKLLIGGGGGPVTKK